MARYGKRFATLLKRARRHPQYWVSRITLDFANRLSEMLKAKGMSKKDLAAKIDTSPAYITKVLRGDANYTVETMVKLAMAVDARVEVRLVPRVEAEWHTEKTLFLGSSACRPIPSGAFLKASNDGQWQTPGIVANG